MLARDLQPLLKSRSADPTGLASCTTGPYDQHLVLYVRVPPYAPWIYKSIKNPSKPRSMSPACKYMQMYADVPLLPSSQA